MSAASRTRAAGLLPRSDEVASAAKPRGGESGWTGGTRSHPQRLVAPGGPRTLRPKLVADRGIHADDGLPAADAGRSLSRDCSLSAARYRRAGDGPSGSGAGPHPRGRGGPGGGPVGPSVMPPICVAVNRKCVQAYLLQWVPSAKGPKSGRRRGLSDGASPAGRPGTARPPVAGGPWGLRSLQGLPMAIRGRHWAGAPVPHGVSPRRMKSS